MMSNDTLTLSENAESAEKDTALPPDPGGKHDENSPRPCPVVAAADAYGQAELFNPARENSIYACV